jgi:hypothetical protein
MVEVTPSCWAHAEPATDVGCAALIEGGATHLSATGQTAMNHVASNAARNLTRCCKCHARNTKAESSTAVKKVRVPFVSATVALTMMQGIE